MGLDEALEDLLRGLVVELHHQGDGVALDELLHDTQFSFIWKHHRT